MPLFPTLLLALVPGVSGVHAGDTQPACDDALSLAPRDAQHGKVDWFDGTYEELLETAEEEGRVVLLSFYSDTCRYCARLDREAYSSEEVVEALADVLCLAVDADSPTGRAIDALYPTEEHYPALIFLDPDGSLRDRMIGYLPESYFLPELERILADEDTLGDLRRKVEETPEDLERIWDYARRLRDFGDHASYDAQVKRLRKLDPKGVSEPLHHLALLDAISILDARDDDAPLREFLAEEAYTDLLFLGWSELARFERRQAIKAERKDRKAAAEAHRLAFHEAHLNAWPNTPLEHRAWYGNHVAWDIYKDWAILDKDVRAKGIEIARIAVDLAPGSPDIIDTLACLLYANGEVEEAIELMKRCISLEPDKVLWQERLERFQSTES